MIAIAALMNNLEKSESLELQSITTSLFFWSISGEKSSIENAVGFIIASPDAD